MFFQCLPLAFVFLRAIRLKYDSLKCRSIIQRDISRMTLFSPRGGKNRELLLIDSAVDPTNSAQFHFLSSDTHLARLCCWTPLLMIDSLILEENGSLSNCSRQNVTTSFRT